MTMNNSLQSHHQDGISYGNVYIMTHSIFSNMIRIGCTPCDTQDYVKSLSEKTPGHYDLFFSLPCNNPCQVKKKIRAHFNEKNYINEFYEVSPHAAKKVLTREAMRIPSLQCH